MGYKSDIEIAREAVKRPIQEIGAKLRPLRNVLVLGFLRLGRH